MSHAATPMSRFASGGGSRGRGNPDLRVACGLQHTGGVRIAVICALGVASWLASGCFYVDPINGRPSAEIVRISEGPVQRGGAPVEVAAAWSDPNSDPVTFAGDTVGGARRHRPREQIGRAHV